MKPEELTKHEWFAGMALQGILSNTELNPYLQTVNNRGGAYGFGKEIQLAVQAADLMIKQLGND